MHKSVLAQFITGVRSLVKSPNKMFRTPIAIISFIIYAIVAYGVMETLAWMIDSVEKPAKTFPKALVTVMLLMVSLYVIMIIMCGFSTNWNQVLGKNHVDLANCEYVIISNLGYELGKGFVLSTGSALNIGSLFAHFACLTVVTGFRSGFMLFYAPIKSFVLGCGNLLPVKLTKLNDKGMPANAMWLQEVIRY